MLKKVITAGMIGGLTLMVWTLLINGIFGFRNRIDMKHVPNETQVYEILKQNIVEPGRYLSNPVLTESNTFPENEPVFSILYGGMGHEAAGSLVFLDLLFAIIVTTLGAWLLSLTSEKILSSYPRRVFFFTLLGLLIAIFSDLSKYGIGKYPLSNAIVLALHNIIIWTVLGLVIGLIIKPGSKKLA